MGTSPYIVTRGIVLRETPVRDTDKILTLLTEDRGKAAVIAKGVRKKNCKYAASAQPLAYSEWTLYQRGEWYYANEGSTIELFDGLRESLEAMALGSYFAELSEAAAEEELPAGPLLRHLLNGLYALSTLHQPPELVKPVFELKYLSLAGYEPLLTGCALCGRPDPAEPCLDIAQGTLRCRVCGTGSVSGAGFLMPLCRDSLAAARRAVYGDERRLYAFRLGGEALERLSQVAEAFLLAQLDRRFRTLDYYHSLFPAGTGNG
ncbi:MAG: DNA repair protein RecO [Oscillibacter sp.]|nr:DNA repair protein RecO [Oscillibacter sp.]